jgi:DtxR family Mn-dependent transcriptional regulator
MYNPLIALLLGLLVLAVLMIIFWPERGLWSRWNHLRQLSERVRTEDALKHIYKMESNGESATLQSVAGVLQINPNQAAELLATMEEAEMVTSKGDSLCLTTPGRQAALHVIRAHRLYERYLADETGYTEAEWHDLADVQEHTLSPQEADQLSAQLGHPAYDPHGDPIPTSQGQIQSHGGKSLTTMPLNENLQIVHIEDEPEAVYAQLVAEGLYPGMRVRLLEITPRRVRFWANGDEHILAPIMASNISVAPVTNGNEVHEEPTQTLDMLPFGEKGEILSISGRVRGPERRRFMDMGILPGTKIEVELNGPASDPRAYLIRGTMIALRKEQARMIAIRNLKEEVQ